MTHLLNKSGGGMPPDSQAESNAVGRLLWFSGTVRFRHNLLIGALTITPKEATRVADFHSDRAIRHRNPFVLSHDFTPEKLAAGCHLPDYAKGKLTGGGFHPFRELLNP